MERKLFIFLLLSVMIFGVLGIVQSQNYDLGGRTIKITLFSSDITPFGDRGDYDYAEPEGPALAHLEWVEEKFNCKIEIPSRIVPDDFRAGVLAGDSPADIFAAHSFWFAPLAAEGFLLPLDDILDEEYFNSLPAVFQEHSYGEFAGSIYQFEGQLLLPEVNVIYWDKGLFENLGLPNLYDLYEDGQWTWEKFKEIAVEATTDLTGDGVTDQWGFGHFWSNVADPQWHFSFAATNNARLFRYDEGRAAFSYDQPEALETLEFLHELVEEGAYQTNVNLEERNVAMAVVPAHFFERLVGTLGHSYGIVPMPMGPSAEQHIAPVRLRWNYSLPILEEEPEALIEVMHALFKTTASYRDINQWERELEERITYWVHDLQAMEVLNWAFLNNISVTEYAYLDGLMNLREALNEIIFEGESPARVINEIKPEAQAILDEIFN